MKHPGIHLVVSLFLTIAPFGPFVSASSAIEPTPELASETMSYASFVISPEGALYAWGDNTWSELGFDSDINAATFTPQAVVFPAGVSGWTAVASSAHTLAIARNGQLFCWGDNSQGQLGLGDMVERGEPTALLVPGVSGWIAVAAGGSHSMAVSSDGQLYVWGGGKFPLHTLPTLFPSPDGVTRWIAVAAGQNFGLASTDTGEIYGLGENEGGQLGGGLEPSSFIPELVKTIRPAGVTKWKAMAAGGSHGLGIGDDNRLYAWGGNWFGQLGTSVPGNALSPVAVAAPNGVTGWRSVSAGQGHSLAIATDGRLFAWGANYAGQLGVGTIDPPEVYQGPAPSSTVTTPTLVVTPPSAGGWRAVAGGNLHSLALGNDCRIYAWGNNGQGQLGFSNGGSSAVPILVNGLPDLCNSDSDHDGVPDSRDQCPNTPAGAVVNADGCSIAELCPCAGPWRNHGEYVLSTIDRAREFQHDGLIDRGEANAIIRDAANSDCGKKGPR